MKTIVLTTALLGAVAFASTSARSETLLHAPSTQYSKEGDQIALTVGLVSSGVLYAALGLPPGLTLDAATGIVTGSLGRTAAGQYVVQMRASTDALIETITFTWVVLDATLPEIASPGVQVSKSGDTVTLQLNGTDASGDRLTFASYGLPPGLTLDAATGLITGHLADHELRTTYTVTVTATDGHVTGGTVFSWIVMPI